MNGKRKITFKSLFKIGHKALIWKGCLVPGDIKAADAFSQIPVGQLQRGQILFLCKMAHSAEQETSLNTGLLFCIRQSRSSSLYNSFCREIVSYGQKGSKTQLQIPDPFGGGISGRFLCRLKESILCHTGSQRKVEGFQVFCQALAVPRRLDLPKKIGLLFG